MLATGMLLWALACAGVDASVPARGESAPSAPLLPSGTSPANTPAVREPPLLDNSATPRDDRDVPKGAAPAELDPRASPRRLDESALPEAISDTPVSPPVAPPTERQKEAQPVKTGGGAKRVEEIK